MQTGRKALQAAGVGSGSAGGLFWGCGGEGGGCAERLRGGSVLRCWLWGKGGGWAACDGPCSSLRFGRRTVVAGRHFVPRTGNRVGR